MTELEKKQFQYHYWAGRHWLAKTIYSEARQEIGRKEVERYSIRWRREITRLEAIQYDAYNLGLVDAIKFASVIMNRDSYSELAQTRLKDYVAKFGDKYPDLTKEDKKAEKAEETTEPTEELSNDV